MARRLCEVSSRVAVVLRHPLGSYNAVDNSRKLLCPVPLVTRTIFRHLGWWSSTGFCLPSVRASTDARRSAQESSAPKGGQVLEFNSKQLQAERRAESSLALQDMFGLSKEEADKVVENVKGFSAVKDKDIRQNYRTLLDFGFSDKLIKELPAALAMPVDILLAKIRLMNFMKWGDIDDTFPFLRMNTTILRRFAGRIKAETTSSGGSNRITLLASKLQCSAMVVSQIMVKHSFMQNMPLAKMEQVLDIMLDAQVSREDIINDIWAMRYSANVIRQKLQRVADAGVTPLKPWMIRCPEETLSKRIQKEVRRRSVLGASGTTIDYLAERLRCGREEVIEMTIKYPRIMRLSGPKIKEVIDFLLKNGYTVDDVRKVPKVLFHSTETMNDRLDRLKQYDHRSESLIPLCKSKQQFEDYLQRIVVKWLKSSSTSE